MPGLFISLPKTFLAAHVGMKENLLANEQAVVTGMDVHETLLHLIRGINRHSTGVSLLAEQISHDRTCDQDLTYTCTCDARFLQKATQQEEQ